MHSFSFFPPLRFSALLLLLPLPLPLPMARSEFWQLMAVCPIRLSCGRFYLGFRRFYVSIAVVNVAMKRIGEELDCWCLY
jgi:hypothetical protein